VTRPLANYLLSLRDPADETNDLGRKAAAILHAQTTLRYLTAEMIKQLNANDRPSLLAPLVGDVYARDRQRRTKLSEHGLWIQQQVEKSFAGMAREVRAPSAPQEEADIHGFLEADADAGVKGVR
jgi:non-canonical poly(A) RNA polymerase PAPD5/7